VSSTNLQELTVRELNRATLARQLLLERETMSIPDAIARLVGLQAQMPSPPHVGLWSRLTEFRAEDLVALIERRQVVRATMMRHTLHLIGARDYLKLRPAVQPALTRALQGIAGRRIAGVDVERLVQAAREFVREQPRTFAEIRVLVGELEPEGDISALTYAVRTHLNLVQVPGGGLWGYPGGGVRYTLAESWLRKPVRTAEDPRELVLRYLAGFGPASVRDIQAWSGLAGLKVVVEELRPKLRSLRDERGRELFDVHGAPLPGADHPAPPRFLPDYDNVILGHADRSRVIAEAHRPAVYLKAARVRATFLLDGFVSGTWGIERAREASTLVIEPFARLAGEDRAALTAEGERLVAFVEPAAKRHAVRVARVARRSG
jgi:Winged helix DNA-binding domain